MWKWSSKKVKLSRYNLIFSLPSIVLPWCSNSCPLLKFNSLLTWIWSPKIGLECRLKAAERGSGCQTGLFWYYFFFWRLTFAPFLFFKWSTHSEKYQQVINEQFKWAQAASIRPARRLPVPLYNQRGGKKIIIITQAHEYKVPAAKHHAGSTMKQLPHRSTCEMSHWSGCFLFFQPWQIQ